MLCVTRYVTTPLYDVAEGGLRSVVRICPHTLNQSFDLDRATPPSRFTPPRATNPHTPLPRFSPLLEAPPSQLHPACFHRVRGSHRLPANRTHFIYLILSSYPSCESSDASKMATPRPSPSDAEIEEPPLAEEATPIRPQVVVVEATPRNSQYTPLDDQPPPPPPRRKHDCGANPDCRKCVLM